MKMSPKYLLLLLAALAFALALGCSSDDPADPDPDPDPDPTGTTALVGDDGSETTDFDSYEQVSLSLADLTPNTLYTINVDDGTKALIGTYELTTDADGEMDAASVLYDPEPGTYTITVVDTDIEFDITVEAPTAVYYQPCDATGTHLNNITVGETVYLSAANGTPDTVVRVFVAPNRYDWEYGMFLYDYTESVEELTFDATGVIPATTIWQAADNASGTSWDVIIDVNRNNLYDAGDYLDGQIGVGFVVQDVDLAKVLIDGHVVERLSSDVNYVYRDLFNTDENVYVYVNPVARMRNLGGNRYVKWYIVPHQAVWADQDPLTPVTTPLGDTVQYGCTNAGRRLIWPAPLTPGQYDVVIDVDGDELYDKGQDFLDGYSGPGDWVGFTVQDEPETKDWTILVYADGEGGLSGTRSQYATEIANAMDGDTYAGVLFDGDDSAGYTECKRYICTPGTVTEDADYGELNMGQALTLYDFLVWGIAKFPADHYMIVLSNHGGSWYNESHPVPNELDYDEANKAMCYDNGDALNMHELERVYRDVKTLVGGKLDVIWYQGCLMGAIEVASVSKDYFDYMVSHETVRYGSENTNKFPNLIAAMNSNPSGATAAEKAVTVETAPNTSFAASYDLSEYNDVESSIRSFVNAALSHADWETFKGEIETILGTVRRVAPPGTVGSLEPYEQNGDLADFFDKIAEATGERAIPENVREAAEDVSFDAAFLVDETAGNTGAERRRDLVAAYRRRIQQLRGRVQRLRLHDQHALAGIPGRIVRRGVPHRVDLGRLASGSRLAPVRRQRQPPVLRPPRHSGRQPRCRRHERLRTRERPDLLHRRGWSRSLRIQDLPVLRRRQHGRIEHRQGVPRRRRQPGAFLVPELVRYPLVACLQHHDRRRQHRDGRHRQQEHRQRRRGDVPRQGVIARSLEAERATAPAVALFLVDGVWSDPSGRAGHLHAHMARRSAGIGEDPEFETRGIEARELERHAALHETFTNIRQVFVETNLDHAVGQFHRGLDPLGATIERHGQDRHLDGLAVIGHTHRAVTTGLRLLDFGADPGHADDEVLAGRALGHGVEGQVGRR